MKYSDLLQEIIRMVDESVTKDELTQAIDSLVSYVKQVDSTLTNKVETGLSKEIVAARKLLGDAELRIQQVIVDTQSANETTLASLKQRTMESIDGLFTKLRLNDRFNEVLAQYEQQYTSRLAEMDNAIQSIPSSEDLAAEASMLIKQIPEEIRNALETLNGEERLDASAIKNLPSTVENVARTVATSTSLWNLQDVNIAGIESGQSILWDGTQWVPFDSTGTYSVFFNCINQTGSDIPKGTAVMYAGALGASGIIKIAPAVADGSYPSITILGVTATAIANGSTGNVVFVGSIKGIDTSIYGTAGKILWLDPTTPGGFTTTEPDAPNLRYAMAATLDSKNNGNIVVRAIYSTSLKDQNDVYIDTGTLAQNDTLIWDATDNRWENSNIKINGYGVQNITVASTAPSSPSVGDLWVEIP
jgi:hypothetical protein